MPSSRCSAVMISALNSGSSGPGSSPGWGHCVVFLGTTLYSHSASLHVGLQIDIGNLDIGEVMLGGNPSMD